MAMQMFTSISTQNIFLSLTRTTSFVALRDEKFTAFGKSFSTRGNWMSFGNSHVTSTIESNNHE